MEIGAQFYTVREQCQNLEGFAETLKKGRISATATCRSPAPAPIRRSG